MPLPDAPDYSKRIYELLKETDLENLTYSQFQGVAEKLFIEPENEDEMRRLVLVQLARMAVRGDWDGFLTGGGGSGGAPTDAEYVVMALNGTLTNERVLAAGTGISLTDGGSGSNATISNAGVTSNVAGTGISVSSATGASTITNTGITNIVVTAPISSTFGSTPTLSLAASGVSAGSYTNTDLTVDANGLITAASNGSGGGSVSFPLNGPNDSAAAPNYSWTNASTSGLFRLTSGTVGISAAGSAAMYFQNTKVEANKTFEVIAGSASTPSLTFAGDGNTGLFSSGADAIGFTVGGNERMTLQNNGVFAYGFRVDGTHSAADPGYSFDVDSDTGMYNSDTNNLSFATGGTERYRIGSAGELLIGGTAAGTAGQVFTSGGSGAAPSWKNILTSAAPSSASDTGITGSIASDANYFYVCTATNTWKRVAIASW